MLYFLINSIPDENHEIMFKMCHSKGSDLKIITDCIILNMNNSCL